MAWPAGLLWQRPRPGSRPTGGGCRLMISESTRPQLSAWSKREDQPARCQVTPFINTALSMMGLLPARVLIAATASVSFVTAQPLSVCPCDASEGYRQHWYTHSVGVNEVCEKFCTMFTARFAPSNLDLLACVCLHVCMSGLKIHRLFIRPLYSLHVDCLLIRTQHVVLICARRSRSTGV